MKYWSYRYTTNKVVGHPVADWVIAPFAIFILLALALSTPLDHHRLRLCNASAGSDCVWQAASWLTRHVHIGNSIVVHHRSLLSIQKRVVVLKKVVVPDTVPSSKLSVSRHSCMMATPMEADVDQRLSMSLDDLIASKKKKVPKAGAGKKGGARAKAASGTASAMKPAGRRRNGAAKDKPAAAAKPAAGGAAQNTAAKKRGGKGAGAGAGLGVRVQALKNAPVRAHLCPLPGVCFLRSCIVRAAALVDSIEHFQSCADAEAAGECGCKRLECRGSDGHRVRTCSLSLALPRIPFASRLESGFVGTVRLITTLLACCCCAGLAGRPMAAGLASRRPVAEAAGASSAGSRPLRPLPTCV